MANAILKIKVMPKSPQTDLGKLLIDLREKAEEVGGKLMQSEEQDVAFGLKTLIITIMWPEEKDTEIVENKLKEVEEVSTLDIIDYRREFG